MGKSISANNLRELHSLTMMTCRPLPSYVPQPTRSVATPRPPAVKGEVLAMLACGCAWLRSRFAPLTAVAASLFARCRLRRNAGLCLTRGMRGLWREGTPLPLSPSAMMRRLYRQEEQADSFFRSRDLFYRYAWRGRTCSFFLAWTHAESTASIWLGLSTALSRSLVE